MIKKSTQLSNTYVTSYLRKLERRLDAVGLRRKDTPIYTDHVKTVRSGVGKNIKELMDRTYRSSFSLSPWAKRVNSVMFYAGVHYSTPHVPYMPPYEVTFYFYDGKRLVVVGSGRGKRVSEARTRAIKSAEMLDRENLPYIHNAEARTYEIGYVSESEVAKENAAK